MEKKSQIAIIREAFKADIPEDPSLWPDYYKQRMDICAVCDKNTANNAFENGVMNKIAKFSAKKIGAQCSACGCFIDRKCWSKNEACGLEEVKGGVPKWNRILMETSKSDLFDVENLSYESCNLSISEDGWSFRLDLGDVPSEGPVAFSFGVKTKKELEYHILRMCSCMDYRNRVMKDGSMQFELRLSTPIPVGDFHKNLSIEYFDPSDVDESGEKKTYTLLMEVVAKVKETNIKPDGGNQNT